MGIKLESPTRTELNGGLFDAWCCGYPELNVEGCINEACWAGYWCCWFWDILGLAPLFGSLGKELSDDADEVLI